MTIAGYETHPAADVFPMLEGAELQALAEDVKANGLRNPIVLTLENGKPLVLDGRNRLRACEMAGVTPRTEFWIGEGSPTAWVVSQNLHRRHLDASQRAMIGAGLVPMYETEAKERQRQGGREKVTAHLQEASRGTAAAKAAQAVNVSERSVAAAVKVTREAPAEVIEAVKVGKMSVSAAAKATREANRKERAKDDERHFRTRPRRSGSASRIPASIPKHARVSIPEFAIFLSARFTFVDKARLGRLLLGEEPDARTT